MAINTGVNISKFVAYAVLGPQPGVDITKLLAYAVLASGTVSPPLWPSFAFADGYVGTPYSQAWDMPTSALTVTYSVLSGSLPPGLSLSALAGNQAKISGTPTTAGTYSFTLRAVNTYGTADQTFSIVIHNPVLLVVPVGAILQGGTIGTAYSETITAQGGSGTGYVYALSSGTLPTSLSLNTSTGVISGTPTVAGTYTFTIGVTDSLSNTGSQSFSITIVAPSSGGGSYVF